MLLDGTSGIKSDAYIEGLGKLAEGSLSFIEGAPTERLPGGKFFLEKYNAQNYSNPPEAYGAFAFAAMNLILDTVEQHGPNRKAVQAALNKVKDLTRLSARSPSTITARTRLPSSLLLSSRTVSGWSGKTVNTRLASVSCLARSSVV